jgi:hypothetical protein
LVGPNAPSGKKMIVFSLIATAYSYAADGCLGHIRKAEAGKNRSALAST